LVNFQEEEKGGKGQKFPTIMTHHGVTYSSENPVYNVLMTNCDHDINPVFHYSFNVVQRKG